MPRLKNRWRSDGKIPEFCFVYVLTTSGRDSFSRMLEISISSVRNAHPERAVVVLTDPASYRAIEKHNADLIEVCDKFEVVASGYNDKSIINRDLKSRMFDVIDGNFIYLDADTVVRRPLEDAWLQDFSVAGVRTGNFRDAQFSNFEVEIYVDWNRTPPRSGSVNGGVLFVRKDPDAARFFEYYRLAWRDLMEKTGRFNDQQALSLAADKLGQPFRFLPSEFNAQELFRPSALIGARIWHFFWSNSDPGAPSNVWEIAVADSDNSNSRPEWSQMLTPYRYSSPIQAICTFLCVADPRAVPRGGVRRSIMRYGMRNTLYRVKSKVKSRLGLQ